MVCGFGAQAVRVDEQEGAAGGVPACLCCRLSVSLVYTFDRSVKGFEGWERAKGKGKGKRKRERFALVVEHDGQDGQLIPLADPIHAARYAEEERPVADDVAHEPLVPDRELDAQCPASGPAEPAAAAVDPRARDPRLDLIGDEDGRGDGLDGEDGVVGYGLSDGGREVGDVVIVAGVVAGLSEGVDVAQAFGVYLFQLGPPV